MMDVLVNLILTSLFLNAQAQNQATIDNQSQAESRLPEAEVRRLAETAPQKEAGSESVGVKVTAQSYMVVDQKSGKILAEENAEERRPIASITKLMTALVFLDHNPGWDQTITIGAGDHREGNIVYLMTGEQVSARDIFYTALVASSNEAAAALATATGLSPDDFVQAMNNKARELGMTQAVFADATGLNADNQATAEDVILLARAAFSRSEILSATSAKEYTINIINKNITRKIFNTDKVLGQTFGLDGRQYRVKAGKTGYLEKAGYCFASQISDENNNGILAVVLGSSTLTNRFVDTKSLAYWVFNNYLWP